MAKTGAVSPARRSLTRDRILGVALDLVDRRGLDALSMRELGRALGVEAMSLYHHFPNKAALLDGVHDRVLSEIDLSERAGAWEEDFRRAAHSYWRVLVAHPKVIPLLLPSPTFSIGARSAVEATLRILRRAGLPTKAAYQMFRIAQALFLGVAMMLAAKPDDRTLAVEIANLGEDAGEFPLLGAALRASGTGDPAADFALGIEVLVLAIRARVGSTRSA